jgi:methylisocitrate lyase
MFLFWLILPSLVIRLITRREELGENKVLRWYLYPLSATRAMQKAALAVFETVRKEGTQVNVLDLMQKRKELYEFLNYHSYEDKIDQLFAGKK